MKIIGHRGAAGLAPENTAAAFKAALVYKLDGIELDVRTTKDKIPIVFHDRKINSQLISELLFSEVLAINSAVLTLEEVLELLDSKVEITLEIKPGSEIEPIIHIIKNYRAQLFIASFDPKLLRKVKLALPSIPLVVNESWSGIRASHRARKLNTQYITMNQLWLWGGFIKLITKQGFKLSAYTVNSHSQANRLKSNGIYAIITDFPDRFLDF